MCSGHSPPALIHDRMLHRSLHRSMQEAAALCNSRAHPPSISTGLAKYYIKIWDFGGGGPRPGLKITNGPFGLIAPHIPQLCWGYAYASSWDALCCEQDDAVLGSASRNGPMHLEPAAHPALAGPGCDIATGVVVRISSGSPRRGPGPAAHRNDRRSHIFPPWAAAAGGALG